MSNNRTEAASADSERYPLCFCVVDHNFMRTTSFLLVHIQEGIHVKEFIDLALVEYPGLIDQLFGRIYHVPDGLSRTGLDKIDSEGWEEVSHGQTFTRDAEALQADPELWTKIPGDRRKAYYVIRKLAPVNAEVIGSGDEDIEHTAQEQLPLLFENIIPAVPPSGFARMSPTDLHKVKLHRVINYNCPRETDSISLTLLSQVFGQFKDDCNCDPDSDMLEEMSKYAIAALGMAEDLSAACDEKLLVKNINNRLQEIYGVVLARDLHPNEMDGYIVRNGRLQLLKESKSRNPSGDALVQGAQYYRIFYENALKESGGLQKADVLPGFLITYQGPLMNVYGIACVEKGQVQCEYLTSVNAGCHWTNKDELYKLARILYALSKALNRLNELSEPPGSPTSRPQKRQKIMQSVRTVWPYPCTFTKRDSSIAVEFKYLQRLDGERYLFVVQPVNKPSSEKLLVKFTQFYSHAVHDKLARAKYAPELLGFTHLPGGWKMVVMEFLQGPVWQDGSSLSEHDTTVQRELSIVRDKILPLLQKKGYVHGDIRMANLMFRMGRAGDDSDPAVKLVDFDYAGEAGKTTYPWNLNTTLRPPGHRPCAPLDFLHDSESLDTIMKGTQGALKNGSGLHK